MENVLLLIGGKTLHAEKNASFERNNPLDNSAVTTAAAASAADAKKAVAAAAAAFPAWSQTLPGERRKLLVKGAACLRANHDKIVAAMMAETGATAIWASHNVHLGVNIFEEAAAIVTQITGDIIPSDTPGNLCMGMRQPAGVVVGIAPWNAPVILGVRAVAVPLACGNTVVLKGAEASPLTHSLIVQSLIEAGFPDGVVNYITNAPQDAADVVEAMIGEPAVRRVNFTGSTKVGRIIGGHCAKYMKPAVLELGGKAPVLVLDDASITDAVNGTIFGAFMNSGQICMSTERIVVDNKIADRFIEALVEKARNLPMGDPRKGNVVLGPVYDMATVRHCNRLIDDALAKGAKLLCGGKAETTLMAATLLDHVTPKMDIYHEETFGPVKVIIRANGDDDAVHIANDSEYGLSSAVFTKDTSRGLRIAAKIQAGLCHINGPTVDDEPQMPFGGVKASGVGHFGGSAGIAEFTELRWVSIQTTQRQYPF